MKVFAFAVLALAVFGVNADVVSDITDAVNAIKEKIPEPVVDIHDVHLEGDYTIEKVSFDANDVVVKGIKAVEIPKLDYDESTGKLDYEFNFADIDALVDLSLVLSGLINIEHNPNIQVDLTDLKLAGSVTIDQSVTPTQVSDLTLLVTLGGTKVELSNILNDDELTDVLTKLLNESLPSIVDTIAKDLEPVVSPIVESIINIILRHV